MNWKALNEKCLSFGGGGFLGSHLTDSLSIHNYNVTIFDIKESPYINGNQKQITGNILDEKLVEDVVKGHDYVYNVAGIADIDECNNKPLETVKANILGNTIILQACVNANIKKYLFASSAYVYSDAGSFYRISKQASELLIEGFWEIYKLPYTVIRYGSLYGERSDRRNSIFRIIEDALIKHTVEYFGDGNEKREFIHVKDAADLSVKVLADEYNNQNLVLTGDSVIEYSDLLSMVNEILHNKMEIIYRKKKQKHIINYPLIHSIQN